MPHSDDGGRDSPRLPNPGSKASPHMPPRAPVDIALASAHPEPGQGAWNHDANAFLAAIVQSSSDAIISKDLQGCVTTWNPAAQRLFGYAAAEIVGRCITVLFPPDRLDEESVILQRIRAGEVIDHFETVRVRKDGVRLHVSLTVSPIRNDAGSIIGVAKIARDITQQKENERQLRATQAKLELHTAELERTVAQRTERLQETVGELEAFSYSLSHDLRAPLRAIKGFTEIVLADHGDKIGEDADYLRRVMTAASRMERLIQEVLAFSRVSRHQLSVVAIDIAKVVRDLVHERPEFHAPRAQIEVSGPMLPVLGDMASVTQCLSNLLGNAVKFVDRGVTPHVRVTTERRGEFVRVNVTDNGIGIDEQSQKRLFTVFQRLATNAVYEGTGLGLAIVRKAAERMGGGVGVLSSPGRGSTFWVELPAA